MQTKTSEARLDFNARRALALERGEKPPTFDEPGDVTAIVGLIGMQQ